MKQKDWSVIIVVVFISAVLSFVLSNFLFGGDNSRQEKVEVVQPITTEFTTPNEKYFNNNSVNPTQTIKIGDGSNNSPFNQ